MNEDCETPAAAVASSDAVVTTHNQRPPVNPPQSNHAHRPPERVGSDNLYRRHSRPNGPFRERSRGCFLPGCSTRSNFGLRSGSPKAAKPGRWFVVAVGKRRRCDEQKVDGD